MTNVVQLAEGRDAIQAYAAAEIARGWPRVLETVHKDNRDVIALIGDLTEEEGTRVTPVDIWSAYDVMKHMTLTMERSHVRFESLLAGKDFVPPPMPDPATVDYGSFTDLRSRYINGTADLLATVRAADPTKALDATSTHPVFGTFNWQGWTVFSHHIHAHDHIGQLTKIVEALRPS